MREDWSAGGPTITLLRCEQDLVDVEEGGLDALDLLPLQRRSFERLLYAVKHV